MKTWPCAPNARVTQGFGENPAWYKKHGLPGHNGLDFALPFGSALYAVDAGVVIETGFDANGYGNYAKIDHPWGESICAHMSKLLVGRGDGVGSGQRIGLSGDTGNSTGPHLHFGLRVKPYDRMVWGGWTDPLPHLKALERKTYRTGPYLAGPEVGSMVDTLRRWRPSVAVHMNPSRDTLQRIKVATPDTQFVARIYKDDSDVTERIRANPQEAARWMDGLIRGHECFGLADYWYVINEVCQVEWSEWLALNTCMSAWIDLAGKDYKCGLYTTSVGQPDLPKHDPLAYWRVTVPVLEKAILRGHALLIHQYGAPTMDEPAVEWYAGRFERQNILLRLDAERSAAARARVPSLLALPVIVGEWGVDHLIHNKRAGWQSNLSADEYTRQLVGMDQFNRRYPWVLGYAAFTCGTENSEDWGTYDIWPEVAKRLADAAERELGGSTPVPEPLHEVLLAEAARRQVIQFNPDAALQKRIFAAGFVPNSPEFEVEHGGVRYVAQRGERLGTGGVRVYYAPAANCNDVAFVP